MDAKYIESANACIDIGRQNHKISFDIMNKGRLNFYINGWDRALCKRLDWDIGDRTTLEFKNGKCSAYFNDELLGDLTDDLPERFYLAVSLYKGTVLETTLFEIM